MSKRKLSDLDGPKERTYNVQTMRLTQKFEHGVILLSRALKTSRGFERQKLGRREKTAKTQGSPETLQRIAEEVAFIKTLDLGATAQRYLFKQMVKTKRIAEAPAFVQFRESKRMDAEGPRSTAEANVTARLYKSNPVKNVFPNVMTDIRKVLGLEELVGGKKEGKDVGRKDSAVKAKTEERAVSVSDSEPEDSRQAAAMLVRSDEGGDEAMSDAESMDFAQFDSRLASGSEDEDEEVGSAGDDASDGGVNRRAHSALSISRSPSPDSPPAKKQKSKSSKASSTPATSTTFLPSLTMGGYFSGSESEAEDLDAEQPRRKNRMGQQARRALWEKKFGTGANHLKQQQNQQRRSRDSGWDLRRGATDGFEGPRGRRGPVRGMTGRPQHHGDRPQRGPPAHKRQPQDDKPLHPSWEAAKRAKEQKTTASFQGKKVTFD